jgi:TonB family protein
MLTYLLNVHLGWALFAAFYFLLLRKDTFFAARRAYLFLSVAMGLLIPFWPKIVTSAEPILQQKWLQVLVVSGQNVQESVNWLTATLAFVQGNIMLTIYLMGCLFFLIKYVREFYLLKKLKKNSNCSAGLYNGTLFLWAQNDKVETPFVLQNTLFWQVGPNDPFSNTNESILKHEVAHIRLKHSYDAMIMLLCCSLFWFSPLVWWFRRALLLVHEYQADALATNHASIEQYGHLLISHTPSGRQLGLTHTFFQSPLKQRLLMLMQKRSKQWNYGKFFLVFPLTILLMSATSLPMLAQRAAQYVVQDGEEMIQVTYENNATKVVEGIKYGKNEPYVGLDTIITFDPDTYIETVRIVESALYDAADVAPVFPGGDAELFKWLAQHIRYPDDARKAKQEGTAYIQFVVDDEGAVRQVKVTKSTGSVSLDKEAFRVIHEMPYWKPGTIKGKPVSVIYTLPIKFKLN